MGEHRTRDFQTSPSGTVPAQRSLESGQALVEYLLIAVIVGIALIVVLTILGPVVGNAFDNTLDRFDPSPTAFDEGSFNDLLTVVASYTPPVEDIGDEETEEAPVNQPPVAVDDEFSTNMDVWFVGNVLGNDYDPDVPPNPLLLVAADSPTAAGGSTELIDPVLGTVRYNPPPGFSGTDTFSYTISDGAIAASATVTVTVIDPTIPTATWTPSPTPADTVHAAPYDDGITDATWWRIDPDLVFLGYEDWEAEWWVWTGSDVADVEAAMNGLSECTTTQAYNAPVEFWWGESGPTPGGACAGSPWQTDYFAARWTHTFGYGPEVGDVNVVLTTVSNGGIRVFIDGEEISAISDWTVRDTTETLSTPFTITSGVEHEIVVEYFEAEGAAAAVFRVGQTDFGASEDTGQCNWAISTSESPHSPEFALADSPGSLYANDSRCEIRLRGAVDLSALSDAPQLTFWDRFALNDYDEARL
ncbi:MAG: cadherin-like domain-containing protein, partial [Anaerolineae bacterium]|nr:cadherin-like domain-containing protein [Anaerolineae bacterium]